MHLMVTNLILNLHIVVVESIVEVDHAYQYDDGKYIGNTTRSRLLFTNMDYM